MSEKTIAMYEQAGRLNELQDDNPESLERTEGIGFRRERFGGREEGEGGKAFAGSEVCQTSLRRFCEGSWGKWGGQEE